MEVQWKNIYAVVTQNNGGKVSCNSGLPWDFDEKTQISLFANPTCMPIDSDRILSDDVLCKSFAFLNWKIWFFLQII